MAMVVGGVGHGWRWCLVGMRTMPVTVDRMLGDARAFPVCEVNTLMTPDQIAVQVRIYG